MLRTDMIRPLGIFLALSFAAAVPLGAQQGSIADAWKKEAAQHGWSTSLPNAREEARQSDKPMMVVFRCIP